MKSETPQDFAEEGYERSLQELKEQVIYLIKEKSEDDLITVIDLMDCFGIKVGDF